MKMHNHHNKMPGEKIDVSQTVKSQSKLDERRKKQMDF